MRGPRAIPHQERLAAAIVDQTLERFPQRARQPWHWPACCPPTRSRGSGCSSSPNHRAAHHLPGCPDFRAAMTGHPRGGCWRAAGCSPRPTTPAFARLHRVLHAHLRHRLADAAIEQRLDTHLQRVSHELRRPPHPIPPCWPSPQRPLPAGLPTARRLTAAGLRLIDPVRAPRPRHRAHPGHRDPEHYQRLAEPTRQHRLAARPVDQPRQGGGCAGRARRCGRRPGALHPGPAHPREAWRGSARHRLAAHLRIAERLAEADPHNTDWQRDLSIRLDRVGDVRAGRGDGAGALEHYTRALRHRRAARRGRPAQHRPAARPVGQPHQGGGCAGGARRGGRRPGSTTPGPCTSPSG